VLRVNGEITEAFNGTLDELLVLLNIRTSGVAVAIDGVVIPRSEWKDTPVPADGAVEIVTAAAGG